MDQNTNPLPENQNPQQPQDPPQNIDDVAKPVDDPQSNAVPSGQTESYHLQNQDPSASANQANGEGEQDGASDSKKKKVKIALIAVGAMAIIAIILVFGRGFLFKGAVTEIQATSEADCTAGGGLWNASLTPSCVDPASVTTSEECSAYGGSWSGAAGVCSLPPPPPAPSESELAQAACTDLGGSFASSATGSSGSSGTVTYTCTVDGSLLTWNGSSFGSEPTPVSTPASTCAGAPLSGTYQAGSGPNGEDECVASDGSTYIWSTTDSTWQFYAGPVVPDAAESACSDLGGTYDAGTQQCSVVGLAGTTVYQWDGSAYTEVGGSPAGDTSATSAGDCADMGGTYGMLSTPDGEQESCMVGDQTYVWDGTQFVPYTGDVATNPAEVTPPPPPEPSPPPASTTASGSGGRSGVSGASGTFVAEGTTPPVVCPSGFAYRVAEKDCVPSVIAANETSGSQSNDTVSNANDTSTLGNAVTNVAAEPQEPSAPAAVNAQTNANVSASTTSSASSSSSTDLHGAYIQGETGPEVLLYPLLLGGANALFYFRKRKNKK